MSRKTKFDHLFSATDMNEVSCLQWQGAYKRVNWFIKNWGVDDRQPSGIFCSYFYINSQCFRTPEALAPWNIDYEASNFLGIQRLRLPYDRLPDIDFHGGITFGERHRHWEDPDAFILEVGCDYNHVWDKDANHPATLYTVKSDICIAITNFLAAYDYDPELNR